MTKKREHGPYKKLLSIFQIDDLIQQHAQSVVFVKNSDEKYVLEPWLKELRFNQAWQIAEGILGRSISEAEFQSAWANTEIVVKKQKAPPTELPNTATFGGYRLRGRSALNRDKKQKPRPKKK